MALFGWAGSAGPSRSRMLCSQSSASPSRDHPSRPNTLNVAILVFLSFSQIKQLAFFFFYELFFKKNSHATLCCTGLAKSTDLTHRDAIHQ